VITLRPLLFALCALPFAICAQAQPQPSAVVNRYCVTCHNQRLKTAKLELDRLDLTHPEKDALAWERAIRKLRGGMMPPPGAARPAAADLQALAGYLETTLDAAGAANPNPGSVRIHRLNRAEYSNAMRDLFGLGVDVSTLLPNDDISEGFDNIASALKVSPSFLDQYIMAARALAKQAVGAPVPEGQTRTTLRGQDAGVSLPPGARSGVTGTFLAPFEGDYEIRATGSAVLFTVDGRAVDTGGRTHLTAGNHPVIMAGAGRGPVESEGALFGFIPGAAGTGYASTGTLTPGTTAVGGRGPVTVPTVTIDGPFDRTGAPVETPNRKKVFICRPSTSSGQVPADPKEESACASRIMATLARRAFRRPVTDADLAPLMQFFAEGRGAGTFEDGIRNALTAMLSSAKFLYRTEPPPANAQPGTIYRLSDLELASRLSFFLWSSIPDDELLTLAEQRKLSAPKTLEAQVRRMLADPRSKTLTTNFAFQWLRVRDTASLDPDPYTYPAFDAPLRAAIRREMELFLDSVFRPSPHSQGEGSVLDLLSANYTFLNERLAQHYRVPDVRGDQFRRVTLTDPNRFGLLGKASVLMVTAYPNRTSPVLRGSYILENLLGTPPAPPPPNVEAFKENKEGEQFKTIRQIMETHRANPTCNACHGVMDPLGFSLENFDTIGTYRAVDAFTRTKIDASGKLVDGTAVNGPADLRAALLAHPEQFVQTLTEKLTTYALGRSIEYYDMPGIRRIVRDSKATNYKFSSIVMGIVNAPAFRSSLVEQ